MYPNNGGTTFSLTINKQEGEANETASVTSSNSEDIRSVLDKFAEIAGEVNPEEYAPYGDETLDVSDTGQEGGCGCEETGDMNMKREQVDRLRHLSGMPVKEAGSFKAAIAKSEKGRQSAIKKAKAAKKKGMSDASCKKEYDLTDADMKKVNEDADFDFRDEGNGPNNPSNFDHDMGITTFARKGHSKKNNKIVNQQGDNPLPDPRESDTMFESLMEDWETFKKEPVKEALLDGEEETYMHGNPQQYRENDLIDVCHANEGWPIAKQLEDLLGKGDKPREPFEEQNPNALRAISDFLKGKGEENLAMEIDAYLHRDDLGAPMGEGIKNHPYLNKKRRSEKEARKDIAKNKRSVVGHNKQKKNSDVEGIAEKRRKKAYQH